MSAMVHTVGDDMADRAAKGLQPRRLIQGVEVAIIGAILGIIFTP